MLNPSELCKIEKFGRVMGLLCEYEQNPANMFDKAYKYGRKYSSYQTIAFD